eukprot:563520-Amphidinium_carterae.1
MTEALDAVRSVGQPQRDMQEVWDESKDASDGVAIEVVEDLASLGALGVDCVDAGKVEAAVIGRCDAVLELQNKQAELAQAEGKLTAALQAKRGKRKHKTTEADDEGALKEVEADAGSKVSSARKRRDGLHEE